MAPLDPSDPLDGRSAGPSTRSVHLTEEVDPHTRAVVPPTTTSSAFAYPDVPTWRAVALGEQPGHIYARNSNPTTDRFEAKVAALLKRHIEQTGSELALELLNQIEQDPRAAFARFTRLIPQGYSRVLEIRERANDAGLDPDGDQVWSQILEATHG